MKHQEKFIFSGISGLNRSLQGKTWEGAKYTLIVDENTFQLCLPQIISQVKPLQEANFIEIPIGEEGKSIEVATQVWETLLESQADRQAVIVNVGGGSVCDLGGFVASGYKRGMRLINIPTTLVGMTDAAIGGKNAINLNGIKNAIGHFYHPDITVIDPVFLSSLPEEEILNGYIEMVKTAIVIDPPLYQKLISEINPTEEHIISIAKWKQRVVKADPYDHGIRHILNFGHTFGHAIESFSSLPHGISVGIGMKAALYLSVHKLKLDEAVYDTYSKWITQFIDIKHYTLKEIEKMLALMHQDKKNSSASVQCVLLKSIGEPVISVEVSDHEIRDALLHI